MRASMALPIVEDLERGLQAVRALIDYAAFRRRDLEPARAGSDARNRKSSAAFDEPRALTEAESKKILGAAGLPVTREALARDRRRTPCASRPRSAARSR